MIVDNVRRAMARPRGGGRPVCLVCGRSVGSREVQMRLRGGIIVHRSCATYDMRRRRVGTARLGYPPSR